MKRILFLTNEYPYGNGEQFIEPEIENSPRNMSIDIIPIRQNKTKHTRSIPSNVCIKDFHYTKLQFFISGIKSIFSLDFISEVNVRKCAQLSITPRSLVSVLGYFSRGRLLANYICKNYRQELLHGDVILYSYWFLYGAYASALVKKRYKIKFYARAHGVDLWDHASPFGKTPGKELVLEKIDRLYVCNKLGVDYLINQYGVKAHNATVGYLGSNDYGYEVNYNRSDMLFRIVSCSRLVPLKRVELIAEALKCIKGIEIEWVHFGDGSEMKKIKTIIKTLPSSVHTVIKGNVPHGEIMSFYQKNRCDLFINVSTTEGLPVSIMEAISFGIPVVATNVGGTSEVVQEDFGALLDRDFQVTDLAKEIERIFELDINAYRTMRTSARIFWENHFSAKKNYSCFFKEIGGLS